MIEFSQLLFVQSTKLLELWRKYETSKSLTINQTFVWVTLVSAFITNDGFIPYNK